MCDLGYLITVVELYPHLYDKSRRLWKDNNAKENSWREISGMVNMTVEDCKRAWKNLRDRYTRERKTIHRSGEEASERSSWEYVEALSFLEPHIRPRKTLGNVSIVKPVEDNEDEEAPELFLQNIESQNPESPVSGETMSSLHSEATTSTLSDDFRQLPRSRKQNTIKHNISQGTSTAPNSEQTETPQRKRKRAEETNVAALVHIAEGIQTSIGRPRAANPVDSAEAFGTFVSTMLRELTPEVRKDKMNKITQVLFE